MEGQIIKAIKESIRVKRIILESRVSQIKKLAEAVIEAYRAKKKVILFGNGGSAEMLIMYLKDLVDLCLIVPSNITPRIQEAHVTIGHIICGIVERELFRTR